MSALLSILALYNYDNTVFDNFVIPIGIDKEDVTNNLLMELAEFEVIYANPDMMKSAIGFWSKKELSVWQKLYNTTMFDYKPLENLYRTEEYTDNETRNLAGSNSETRNLAGSNNETRNLFGSNNETRNLAGSELETRNLSGSNNETRNLDGSNRETRDLAGTAEHDSTTTGTTQNNGTDTLKEYVSAFNETTPTLSKQTEQILGAGNTVDGTVETTDTTTDTGTVNTATTDTGTVNTATTDTGTVNNATTDTGSVNISMSDNGSVNRAITDTGNVNREITDTGTVEKTQTASMHGSIGVITPQDMIEKERKVVQFNVINYIIDSFKSRFCILIY
jgi:hypothetical protein